MSELLGEPEATPIAPAGDGWTLVGSVCGECGTRAFPARAVCHVCTARRPDPAPVGAAGILYSWTTVHVSASRPVPYTLGYVDLAQDGADGPDLRVLAHLRGEPEDWRVGAPVALAVAGDDWYFQRSVQ
jgi:uncharacterized OB-fold protein